MSCKIMSHPCECMAKNRGWACRSFHLGGSSAAGGVWYPVKSVLWMDGWSVNSNFSVSEVVLSVCADERAGKKKTHTQTENEDKVDTFSLLRSVAPKMKALSITK